MYETEEPAGALSCKRPLVMIKWSVVPVHAGFENNSLSEKSSSSWLKACGGFNKAIGKTIAVNDFRIEKMNFWLTVFISTTVKE